MAKKKSVPTPKPKQKTTSCGVITPKMLRAIEKGEERKIRNASGINAASGTGPHKNEATDITTIRSKNRQLGRRATRGDFDDD